MSRVFEALQKSAFERGPSHSLDTGASSKVPDSMALMAEDAASLRATATFSLPSGQEKRLVAASDHLSLGAEKFRILSARLKHVQQSRPIKKVLITSAIRAEGKTMIAANLGITLAQQRRRVLLIDGDLHQPNLGFLLGVMSRPGLADWWRQQREISDFLCRAEGLPLWLLPAGGQLDRPLTLLQSSEVAQLIANISGWFDWVIIDSPPLAPLADAGVWSGLADSVLLVSRQGVTPKRVLEDNLATLDKAKILGVVLNDADSSEERYYAGYYKLQRHRPAANRSAQKKVVAATSALGKNNEFPSEL
jgi:capsular exopolysaccharide synthesis family protein